MREFDLLQHIFARNTGLPDSVTLPPGDDMGAVTIGGRMVLVTVDQVTDGVHVNMANTPLELIGRKAVVRNLSDVAAMAALPVGAVAAVCLPRDFGDDRARALFEAMARTAEPYGCPLIGGDICIADGPLVLAVTVFAEPAGIAPVRRSGAKAGDVIFVTGQLGGAWDESGGGAHLTAEPRIATARALAKLLGDDLHSMIDLSDGLSCDLGHIVEQSDLDGWIEVEQLPIRDHVAEPRADHALHDGEDYELCFTVAAAAAGKLPEKLAEVRVTRIGMMKKRRVDRPTVWLARADGSVEPCPTGGWEHGHE